MSGGATTDEYTYDLATPRRPDEDDLGGTELQDRRGSEPQKGDEVYAGQINEHGRNLAGLNRLTPTVRLWLEWDGADWVVTGVDAMATANKLNETSFTAATGGTGIADISWTAGTLPAMQRSPRAWATGAFGHAYGATNGANAIQVRVSNAGGTLTNSDFAVEIF